MDFTPPLRASKHCRHYSYVLPITRADSGPRCAKGCAIAAFGGTGACMPEPSKPCRLREDYSDDERAAWRSWVDSRMERLGSAVKALPRAIPLRTSGSVPCPSCDGTVHYSRWHRGAELHCTTEGCCAAHFSIAAGKDWPCD